MKPARSDILSVAAVLIAFTALAAETLIEPAGPLAPSPTNQPASPAAGSRAFTNQLGTGTFDFKPGLPHKTIIHLPAAPEMLPPGIYLTKPYTCILMVPGPQHDDGCMNRWTAPTEPMPVLRPDLKTVPLGRHDQ